MKEHLVNRLPPMPDGLSRDVVHSEAYFSQFLKKMENDIVTLSEKFWPYFFFLWLAYSLILIVIRIFLIYGSDLRFYFVYFGLFYDNPSLDVKIQILQNEQIGNQVIFGFLIVEFLVIHYYFSLPNNINLMPEHKIEILVKMMDAKVDLYSLEPNQKDTRMFVLRKTYNDLAKQLEGENEEEREEMTQFIRMRTSVTDDKAFRGIRFPNDKPHTDNFLIPEVDEDVENPDDEVDALMGNLNDVHEFRGRTETGFKIDENLVLNNLQLDSEATFNDMQRYTSEHQILNMVTNLLPDFENEKGALPQERGNEASRTHQEQGFAELEEEEEKKEVHILIYMDQYTTTQIKVLYKERNNHVFHLARMLNSLSYVTGRLMILPLLYSLSDNTSMNFFIMFVTAAYIFRFNVGPFESQMSLYMPIFTLVIFLETLLLYLVSLPIPFMQDNLKNYANIAKTGSVVGYSSFYRLWLIAIASVGYASIIWTSKFIFSHMFSIRQRVSDIFYSYSLADRKIEVDFGRWKHYHLIVSTWLCNEVYAQLNDIYITCTIIYCLMNSDMKILLVIMICMFGYNILMRLRKSYTSLVMEEQAVDKLRYVIKAVVVLLFLLEFFLQIVNFMSLLKLEIPNYFDFVRHWKVIGSHIMIIVSLLVYDLLRTENFVLEKRRVVCASELKMKFADICEAQETNESKIYERVLLMIANDRLQNQIDRYLKTGIINSMADLNYHKTDIKQHLSEMRYNFLEKYLENIQISKMKTIESFYSSLLNHCNQFIQQDMLYLVSRVHQIDYELLESDSEVRFNFTEYLSGNYARLHEMYKFILNYYKDLLNKEDIYFKGYKKRMNNFERHTDRTMAHENEQELEAAQDSVQSAKLRAPKGKKISKEKLEEILRTQRKSHGDNSDEEEHQSIHEEDVKKKRSPAEILANFLLKDHSGTKNFDKYNARGGAKFQIEEENCSLIFHHLKQDSLNRTQGFTKIKFFEILSIFTCLFWSHLEAIISLCIIIVLYINGGLMSAVIIGIIFFRIMVEERGGPLIWWEALNICFFIQFVCKIFSSSSQISSEDKSQILVLVEILGGNTEGNASRNDAFVQILIMWLIHFINKKIINLPEGKNLVTTGVSIARVGFIY